MKKHMKNQKTTKKAEKYWNKKVGKHMKRLRKVEKT